MPGAKYSARVQLQKLPTQREPLSRLKLMTMIQKIKESSHQATSASKAHESQKLLKLLEFISKLGIK